MKYQFPLDEVPTFELDHRKRDSADSIKNLMKFVKISS